MKKRKHEFREPTIEQLKNELNRERYKRRYFLVIRSTVYSLITVAAVAVLVATLWLPVLQIYGGSMSPTLVDGNIVVSVKTSDLQPGDIVYVEGFGWLEYQGPNHCEYGADISENGNKIGIMG